ncbi:MAG: prepilin peptidase [Burkholderiaceae bacterium]|nr:prepilin peptidase [Burkholderiaceae bacterium]MDH5207798.1 prepilin peptidase [Burkholderiaceae bacterium]
MTDPALVLAAAAFGLAIGSFLNVVIHRLPRMMENEWKAQCAELAGEAAVVPGPRYNLVVPRSHCPHCNSPLRVRDNIPVVSWLLLRGKCAHCGSRISARYPIVELLTAALSAVVAFRFGFTPATLLALVFTWTLVALTFIDADTTLLPDDLTLPLLWLGLGANVVGTFVPLKDAVIGAIVGYLALWSIYWLFKLATGKEGMGYGDFKLLAALGAWVGWKALLPVVLLSSLVGALVGIVLIILARRGREIPIPFGPYLATAGFIVLVAGDAFTHWFVPL